MKKWVKCSERLPSEGGKSYLVAIDNGKTVMDAMYYHTNMWLREGLVIQGVSHWRPLPKPPKDEHE